MKLSKGQKVVFIGDSVTDCGRAQPVGEGLFGAIGSGWVSVVDGIVNSVHPELHTRMVNMGTSGNTVRDLKARWDRDVIDQKPDWVSIMIGANDVWRQFDVPTITEAAVPIEEYAQTLEGLVDQTLPLVSGLVMMTPYFMEPNRDDPMRKAMDAYGNVVKEIASTRNVVFIDTQAAFDEILAHFYSATIGWDRIHSNHTGNCLMAVTWLKAMGLAF